MATAAATTKRATRAEEARPPRANHKVLILAITCLAQFMVVLDVAIVNVALPAMQKDLNLAQSALQWVVIAYGLLLGGFLLLGGRLGDLLGRRRVLLTGLALFSAASLVAGLSQSAELLIAMRALQGFGAALVAPSALSILAVTFTEGSERNFALGIFGAVGGLSASVGVIASGLLTDGPGWRWIFFINVPVGIALIALAARAIVRDAPDGSVRRHFDAAGATTVTGGLLLFVYALNRGVDTGWASATTLGLFGAAAVLLASFVWIESRSRSPLIPGTALRNRTMVAADVSSFLLFGAFFSFIFLGSLMMQQLLRYSPTRAGVGWLATSVVAFVAAAVTGAKLVNVIGVKRLLVAAMSLLALGVLWLTRIPAGADYLTDILPAFVLAGLAIGFSAPSVQIGALSGVAGESAGLASGLVETMREIGGAVGIAAVSTVLVSRTNDAIAGGSTPQAAGLEGFQSAYVVIVAFAALGAVIALLGFPRARRATARAAAERSGDTLVERKPLSYWLRRAERAYVEQFDQLFSERGLSRLHWRVVSNLDGTPRTKTDIHAAVGGNTEAQRLDAAVADLVRMGWLARQGVGKQTAYALTTDGHIGKRDVLRRAAHVGRRAVNGLSPGEHDAAAKALERIVVNLKDGQGADVLAGSGKEKR